MILSWNAPTPTCELAPSPTALPSLAPISKGAGLLPHTRGIMQHLERWPISSTAPQTYELSADLCWSIDHVVLGKLGKRISHDVWLISAETEKSVWVASLPIVDWLVCLVA
jgi:hypothetical protein